MLGRKLLLLDSPLPSPPLGAWSPFNLSTFQPPNLLTHKPQTYKPNKRLLALLASVGAVREPRRRVSLSSALVPSPGFLINGSP
jgi:hypothetical protein